MGDVAERSGMHERRLALHGLDDVWQERILEQYGHGAGDPQILGRYQGTILALCHQDPPDPPAQIFHVSRQRQDGHDLRGGRDDEARLARDPMLIAAEPGHDVAQRPVVDVERARPGDKARSHLELAVKDGRIDDCGQQVVGGLHGMDVPVEVKVDVLHRDDLGLAAPRSTALDPEERSGRGLA